jgi:hypothetical protein
MKREEKITIFYFQFIFVTISSRPTEGQAESACDHDSPDKLPPYQL